MESDSDSESTSESDVADLTRPKRQIMDRVPKDPKGRGRKRKHQAQKRTRINWKNPLVFAVIQEAQREVRKIDRREEWSPSAIVKQCQAKSFRLFRGLTSQVLG